MPNIQLLTQVFIFGENTAMLKFPCLVLFIFLSVPALAQNQVKFSEIIPGMKNEWLENECIRLGNKRAAEYMWPEEFSRAKILSKKWEILYDRNGFAKARKIHVQLYGTMNSGRCGMADFFFKENLLGDETWSDVLVYHSVGDIVYVDCE